MWRSLANASCCGVGFTVVPPACLVRALGWVSTVAPLTATVLSSVDDHHAGIASGVNNAVARSAQLMAVAAIPMAAGITGDSYRDPLAFQNGFDNALWITAQATMCDSHERRGHSLRQRFGNAFHRWQTLGQSFHQRHPK